MASKVADIPLAKPGFDTLGMSAPIMMQMNPTGKWENNSPNNLDEERLKAVVGHLVKSNVVNAAQSFCSQCAMENKVKGSSGMSNYVPVIMMPIYPADQCPFDIKCVTDKTAAAPVKHAKKTAQASEEKAEDVKTQKKKKRGFVLQRLTDFDLMSQW